MDIKHTNPFMNPVDSYKRNLNLRAGVVKQTAKYISLKLGKPYEEILPLVKQEMANDPKLKIKDAPMKYLRKVRNGQRELEEISFLQYLDLAIQTGRILSPSCVVYETAEENKSTTALWQDVNIAARKRSKQEMFRLGQIGDQIGAMLADYDQNARKIRINSVSGMRGFKGCALFLKTGHSSLTSLCRAAAGYGNATVERFLGGSRHYHTPEIAKANLMAVLTLENQDRWIPVVEKYNIHYPTVEETFAMVKRSTESYWESDEEDRNIRHLIGQMTPMERLICVYSGDMYHLVTYNPELGHELFDKLMLVDYIEELPDWEVDTEAELEVLDSTEKAYVFALCSETLRGTTLDLLEEENPDGFRQVGVTAKLVRETLVEYTDLINVLFVPKHLPPSVGNIRDMMRSTGIIADTDSTIFTTQWWVEWKQGHIQRGAIEDRVWYFTTYSVCQGIAHSLATLSANVGVESKFTTRLAMKNEYGFPVLMNTNGSKTYAALVSMREGNVYKEYELDLKGVGLRGSTAAKSILDGVKGLINDLLMSIDTGKQLYARDVLQQIADTEIRVMTAIRAGDLEFLRNDTIKPDGIKMQHLDLWQNVFAPKYGDAAEPPLPVLKVSLDIPNKTALNSWISSIQDDRIQRELKAWFTKRNKTDFKTILLPYQAVRKDGIPEEVLSAINLKKLTYDICRGYYLVLEACGLFLVDRDNRRLVHEFLNIDPGFEVVDFE